MKIKFLCNHSIKELSIPIDLLERSIKKILATPSIPDKFNIYSVNIEVYGMFAISLIKTTKKKRILFQRTR